MKYVSKGNGAPRGGEFVSGEEIAMEKRIMRKMKQFLETDCNRKVHHEGDEAVPEAEPQ